MSKYCHCCHQPRGWEDLVQCVGSTKKGRGHAWCYRCISTWLNLSPLFMKSLQKEGSGWICPKCDGSGCPCSTCRPKSKGEGDRRHKPMKAEQLAEIKTTAPRSSLPQRPGGGNYKGMLAAAAYPSSSGGRGFSGGAWESEEKKVDPYEETRTNNRRKQSAPKRSPEPSVDTDVPDVLPPKKRICQELRGFQQGLGVDARSNGTVSGDDGSEQGSSDDDSVQGIRAQPSTPSKGSPSGGPSRGGGHHNVEGGGSVSPSDEEEGGGKEHQAGRPWSPLRSGDAGSPHSDHDEQWDELRASVSTMLGHSIADGAAPAAKKRGRGAGAGAGEGAAAGTPAKRAKPPAKSPGKPAPPAAEEKDAGAKFRAQWAPPPSPYGLIQESLYEDPWRVMLSCILLNKTTGHQVRSVIYEFFKVIPTPEAAVEADVEVLEMLIQPLGIFRKRARSIQRFSKEYLDGNWKDPGQLHGVGKYGGDAYLIFCKGEWQGVQAEDKELKKYLQFLHDTQGLGTGLEREAAPTPTPTPGVVTPVVSGGAPPVQVGGDD